MDLSALTSGGGTIVIKGKTYHLKKMKITDIGDIQNFIKERTESPFVTAKEGMEILRPALPPKAPKPPKAAKDKPSAKEKAEFSVLQAKYEEELEAYQQKYEEYEFLLEDYKASRRILLEMANADHKNLGGIDSASSDRIMKSFEGIAYLLFLAMRDNHPDASYDQILADIKDEDLEFIRHKLDSINELPHDLEEEVNQKNSSPATAANPTGH